jgi:hypothetical protein
MYDSIDHRPRYLVLISSAIPVRGGAWSIDRALDREI